ncbi:ComF family protein [Polynucleobacter sp. JS-Polo-80-F4]|uniref:ComF family protein n=1 Tax=Polynucleobacter sp. JS-Polo-80-F4 TaxID=2576918 RepID=UPI002103A54A|nr:phosphoribosyltransferase family protein [Polynucleobacter sp. JS-Polo-80-F4]
MFNYQCCCQCGIALQAPEVALQKCVACQHLEPYFDETYCLDRYEGLLQKPLHELKYQKRIAFANALSNTWNLLIGKDFVNTHADYLLPVPLSTQKLAQRGFNQSWEIARRIYCGQHIQKTPYVLQRHHYSEHQAGSSLNNRQQAIQGMFYVAADDIQKLQNKTVIIFDDVMTSGATLNEIARVLKDNGVSRVINWVLLRAARPI